MSPSLDSSGDYGPATDSEVATQRRSASAIVIHGEYHNKPAAFTTTRVFEPAQIQYLLPLAHQTRTTSWYISFSIVLIILFHEYASSNNYQTMAPTPNLSDREQELLVLVFQCLKNPPEVDLDKFAARSGYKTRASANTAYHKLKGKIGKADDDADNADGGASEDAEADAQDTPVAPSKKARGKKAVAVKTEEPETDEDDESEAIAVKAKAKPKRKAAVTQPSNVRRSARNSLKASKPSIKDESSADSEEEVVKRPITLKRGKITYPTEEEMRVVVAEVSAGAPQDAPTDTNTLKRAAAEPASDDELANDTNKRVKVETDAFTVEPVEPTPAVVETTTITSVVSVDPVVETYVVNDPDAVDPSADIIMAVDDASSDVDAEGDTDVASDVPSNVASAATSGDHDDV
ncbi:hypothetical protein KCU65_g7620, partial [Aureobasidium melanogenum]